METRTQPVSLRCFSVDPWSPERSQYKAQCNKKKKSGFAWPSLTDYVFALLGLRALATLICAATVFYFTHLHETPITGRRRFIFLGDETMRYLSQRRFAEETGQPFTTKKKLAPSGGAESECCEQSVSPSSASPSASVSPSSSSSAEEKEGSVITQHILPADHPFAQFVHDIGMDLVKASRLHDIDWRFLVVDDWENMARCLPDGTVFVHAGRLQSAAALYSKAGYSQQLGLSGLLGLLV